VPHKPAASPLRARIRPATQDDIETLQEIARGSPEAADWSKQAYTQLIGHQGVVSLVLERQDRLDGFLIARQAGDEAELLNLAVRFESRRQGHASALLSAALNEFRGNRVVRAFLEVRVSNRTAISFYTKHGFQTVGRRKAYYRDPVEDALRMENKIVCPKS